MRPENIFRIDLALGFVAWGLVVSLYLWPCLRALDRKQALVRIATLHSFRFFGLVFLLPGYVSNSLPQSFVVPAAYGDLAAALLALGALVTYRSNILFWPLVWGFNLVGAADLLDNFVNAIRFNLPETAGSFGAAYWIPILYVPLLLLTHGLAFYLLVRPAPTKLRSLKDLTARMSV